MPILHFVVQLHQIRADSFFRHFVGERVPTGVGRRDDPEGDPVEVTGRYWQGRVYFSMYTECTYATADKWRRCGHVSHRKGHVPIGYSRLGAPTVEAYKLV